MRISIPKQLVLFFILVCILTIKCSFADLGLDRDDFNGRQVTGKIVSGKKVSGKRVTFNADGSKETSTGKPGSEVSPCKTTLSQGVTEGDGFCVPEVCVTVQSFVNLFSRRYQDDVVDMYVKVPGGSLKVYRIYEEGKWRFEHEHNSLKLNNLASGNIVKSSLTYKKAEDNLYRYKQFTIEHKNNLYRWKNKDGDYVVYSNKGYMVETGNRIGVTSRYTYSNNQLTAIKDRNSNPVYTFQYGTTGKIIKAMDQHGRKVSYQWQDENLLSVTDVLGHVTRYNYSKAGQLISKSDDAGRKFFITYHPDGAVESVLARSGGGHFFSYKQLEDHGQYYAKVTSSLGNIKEYWFDTNGETVKIKENDRLVREDIWHNGKRTSTDEIGNRTVKSYDKNRNLIKEEYLDGTFIGYRYDSKNNIISLRNERGIENRFSNNQRGLLIKKMEAYGTPDEIVTEFTYDDHGNVASIRFQSETGPLVTSYMYDEFDNLIQKTNPLGEVESFQYDYMGNEIISKDPNGLVTKKEYDEKGNLVSVTPPNGLESRFSYDAAGRQLTATGDNGAPTRFSYDFQDNLIQVEDSAGGIVRSNFDKENRLTKRVDEEGRYNVYFYDGASTRINKIIDGSGNEIKITYRGFDDCGSCPKTFSDKPVRIEFPTFVRQFKYDHRSRIVEKSDVNGMTFQTEKYTYDKTGNPISRTDVDGKTTRMEYDSLNRLTEVIDSAGGKTRVAYNRQGNIIRLTDAKGQTTQFEYDALGNKTKEIYPLGNSIEYSYDLAGRLLTKTDAQGQQISYHYNQGTGYLDGYVLKKSSNDFTGENVNFTYDRQGQLTGYDDGTTSASYELDSFGRRIKTTINYGNFTSSHSYSYYRNGLKQSYVGPNGRINRYIYNPINQLQTISVQDVGNIEFSDYRWLKAEQIHMPGIERKDTFDYKLRLTKRTNQTKAAEQSIVDLSYQYNATDNIVQKISGKNVTEYSYDEHQRLTSVQEAGGLSHTYAYDSVDNRISSLKEGSYTYNANNQLMAVGDTRYAYDMNGNTIKRTTKEHTTKYNYTIDNKLSQVNQVGLDIHYYYDPFGRRLSKEVNGQKTWFSYSEEGLVAEYDDGGNLLTTYTWKPGSKWSTDPVMLTKGDKCYFYHNDHMGAPQALTDESGEVVWQAKYDAYGAVQIVKDDVESNLRFPGQYFDSETGLYYNWQRYYEPETGRYISADPIGFSGGINFYAYLAGNPVNYIDPEGQAGAAVAVIVVGGVLYVLTNPDIANPVSAEDINAAINSSGLKGIITDGMIDLGTLGTGKVFVKLGGKKFLVAASVKLTDKVKSAASKAMAGLKSKTVTVTTKICDKVKEFKVKLTWLSKGDGVPTGVCFTAGTLVRTPDNTFAPIETIRVGQRVVTIGDKDVTGSKINPDTWRLVRLSMPNPDGSNDTIVIEALRPLEWIEKAGAKHGEWIPFNLPEMGLKGQALVKEIADIPVIDGGQGRVVLSTVKHLNGNVYKVTFQESEEVLQPTNLHRLFSEERQDWVPVEQLEEGERLRSRNGDVVVASITPLKGIHEVFNIEVETEHSYLVSSLEVLSHNVNPCGEFLKTITKLQKVFDDLAEKHLLPKYRQLDPNLKAGYTGSFKTGVVGNPNKSTFGDPIDLNNFDIDYWIESDILYEKFGKNLRADVEFREILSQTPGFEGLKPNKQGFSIKFRPLTK